MELTETVERAATEAVGDAVEVCEERERAGTIDREELRRLEEELAGKLGGGPGAPGEEGREGPLGEGRHDGEVRPLLPKSSEITTKELGKRGENAAAAYLEYKGYQILERNWVCRFGEADIIAADADGTIVFIEVKTRRSVECGLPEEAITPEKQHRYEKIALAYLMEADWDDCIDLRFDAIGICVTGDYSAMLRHHKACFNGL